MERYVAAKSHNKENTLRRMIAFSDKPPYGEGGGMPCGACREFFTQLSLENKNMEILVNYSTRQTEALEALMPKW